VKREIDATDPLGVRGNLCKLDMLAARGSVRKSNMSLVVASASVAAFLKTIQLWLGLHGLNISENTA
jgi:hypothetical protein